jgi:glycosyltransferase involved in cell wall biosynthesis
MERSDFTVYIVSGCDRGMTTIYRCFHKQEQLALYGIPSTVREHYHPGKVTLDEALAHDVVILHRVAYDPLIGGIIRQARAQGKPVLFDVDDLVFEPDLTHYVDALKYMSPEALELYHDGVRRNLKTLLACDAVLTSTELLADFARQRGKPAFVLRNALSKEQTEVAEQALRQKPAVLSDRLIIGYASGTATHDADFQEAVSALPQILERFREVELHLFGEITSPPELTRFEDRVKRLPLVHLLEMPVVMSNWHINLAPLELDNPYCRAKSELKYIEAGVLALPTVASRVDAYQIAIAHGENGSLVSGTGEWIAALESLIINESLRQSMGQRAREDVCRRYTSEARSRDLIAILNEIRSLGPIGSMHAIPVMDITTVAEPEAETELQAPTSVPLVINWVVGEAIKGSGGHMDIFRTINFLADFGHQQNVYFMPHEHWGNKGDAEVEAVVREDFFALKANVYRWNGQVQDADLTIATFWTTAYVVIELPNGGQKVYFVQDYEPFFHPMGTHHLLADQSYALPFKFVTLGWWLARLIREKYDGDADYFDLALDHDIYYPRSLQRLSSPPRVAFYARPRTPRRAFEMGLEALSLVHHQLPDAEILFYGAEDLGMFVPFPHTNLGILPPNELANLFSTCDVGLVLSTTNCSLIPLEMMACRCAVVDLNLPTVEGVLAHGETAFLADPTPQAIADAVVRLLKDDALCNRIIENAYQHVQTLSWEKSARQVEAILLQCVPSETRLLARSDAPQRNSGLWQIALRPEPEREATAPSAPGAKVAAVSRQNQELAAALYRAQDGLFRHRRRLFSRLSGGLAQLFRRVQRYKQTAFIASHRVEIHRTEELVGKRSEGQTFRATRPNLSRLDVLISTYGRANTRDVILHLRPGPDATEDLRTVHVNAGLMRDNEYATFRFEPLPDSWRKTYFLLLTSPDSIPGDAIGLWVRPRGDRPERTRYQDGQVADGELILGDYYQVKLQSEQGERPLPIAWWVMPTPWWDQLRKAWQFVRQGGLGRLKDEIRKYLYWRRTTKR